MIASGGQGPGEKKEDGKGLHETFFLWVSGQCPKNYPVILRAYGFHFRSVGRAGAEIIIFKNLFFKYPLGLSS